MVLITTTTAAKILAVSPGMIRKLIKAGILPAVRIASEYRIDQEDLSAYIRANKTRVIM